MTNYNSLSFINLPIIVQEKILNYLSYAELSRLRSISKHLHQLCSEQLNRGYFQLEVIIHDLQKQTKAKLPRRESERHRHPLSTKYDIISSLDSRIQWLKLTFGPAIQSSFCCFYPGRLLDEIYSVLGHLRKQQTFTNPCTLLQETRDMSSMAIEHFREQIKPKLQPIRTNSLTTIRNTVPTYSAINHSTLSQYHKRSTNRMLSRQLDIVNYRIYKQNILIRTQKYQLKHYKQILRQRTKSLINHHRRLKYLEKKSKETERILLEMRKDNDTLLQRFDQFILAYGEMSTNIGNANCDEMSSHINTNLKRRRID